MYTTLYFAEMMDVAKSPYKNKRIDFLKQVLTRLAHWHHYWTGKQDGERSLVLHWIAPTIVNGQHLSH